MTVTTRQKIKEEIKNLNNTIIQLDIKDIYRTLYPTTDEYTFFQMTTLQERSHVSSQNSLSYFLNIETYKLYSSTAIK